MAAAIPPMRLVVAVRREPFGGCFSCCRCETDAGQLALLRFNPSLRLVDFEEIQSATRDDADVVCTGWNEQR